jgi:hypothetical protein
MGSLFSARRKDFAFSLQERRPASPGDLPGLLRLSRQIKRMTIGALARGCSASEPRQPHDNVSTLEPVSRHLSHRRFLSKILMMREQSTYLLMEPQALFLSPHLVGIIRAARLLQGICTGGVTADGRPT